MKWVVAGVMASRGFDIPLSQIDDIPGAGDAFIDGWKAAYLLVTGFSALGLLMSIITKPKYAEQEAVLGEIKEEHLLDMVERRTRAFAASQTRGT